MTYKNKFEYAHEQFYKPLLEAKTEEEKAAVIDFIVSKYYEQVNWTKAYAMECSNKNHNRVLRNFERLQHDDYEQYYKKIEEEMNKVNEENE